jgi:hypothetical protein
MELSGAGLAGAFAGLVLGWANYVLVLRVVERSLRRLDRSETPQERAVFAHKLALMRRIILAVDVVGFTIIGYALGRVVGD